MSNLISFLEQFALLSLEKQERFSRLVGEHSMELDLDAGVIRLSGGFEFPFQVLGTESHNTVTWLWAWADEQAEVPPALLRASLEMRAWGAKESIAECITASVDLDNADGNLFSIIASQVCRASCYYQDSYDGGALFLLLYGVSLDRQPALDEAGLFRQCLRLVTMHDMNHRNALLAYLRIKQIDYQEQAERITARLESGESILAEFDAAGRFVALNGRPLT
jgi:hypothetical protein